LTTISSISHFLLFFKHAADCSKTKALRLPKALFPEHPQRITQSSPSS
jgi:hypothetical protein